jgi:hypothetical protein
MGEKAFKLNTPYFKSKVNQKRMQVPEQQDIQAWPALRNKDTA